MMRIETPNFVIIACILSWSILTVWGRIILLEYQLAPATFVFIQMLSGGLVLMLLSRSKMKTLGFTALKQTSTWAFGFLRVFSASFYVAALYYLSATNVAFLGAAGVIISVLIVWLTLKRKPTVKELPGHLIILVAVYFMIMQFSDGFANPAIWLLLVSQVIISFAIILGEIHPLNQNNDSKETLYLTGMVLLASAAILLVLSYIASILEPMLPSDFYPNIRSQISGFILEDILNPYAWIFGGLMGALFRSSSIYYSLRAVKLTSSEFYLGTMSLMPFSNMLFEYIAAYFGYLPHGNYDLNMLIAGIFITLGSLYIIFFKRAPKAAKKAA